MNKFKHYQWDQIKDWFCPEPGYVLDFSNKTFKEFFEDHFQTNIYADAFSQHGTSKFNRLQSFLEVSPPHLVIEALRLLWTRKNYERDNNIEIAASQNERDSWTVSNECLEAIFNEAESEDSSFNKLIHEIGGRPSHSATPHLQSISAEWTLDTLDLEMSRAIDNIEKDPEAAITAASSMIESIFRSVLLGRNLPLPKNMDIQTLYKAAREPLGLSPSKELENSEIQADVRTILAAIGNVVQGIGALRTHAGKAHGRERGFQRVDPRIARLSVNSSTALALFLVETWEKRFPDDRLTMK